MDADREYLGVFTAANPVDYKAPDGKPVDVFFVTVGPPSVRNTHLRLQAGIAKLVLNTPVLERLRAADGDQDLRAVFENAGQAIGTTPRARTRRLPRRRGA